MGAFPFIWSGRNALSHQQQRRATDAFILLRVRASRFIFVIYDKQQGPAAVCVFLEAARRAGTTQRPGTPIHLEPLRARKRERALILSIYPSICRARTLPARRECLRTDKSHLRFGTLPTRACSFFTPLAASIKTPDASHSHFSDTQFNSRYTKTVTNKGT